MSNIEQAILNASLNELEMKEQNIPQEKTENSSSNIPLLAIP